MKLYRIFETGLRFRYTTSDEKSEYLTMLDVFLKERWEPCRMKYSIYNRQLRRMPGLLVLKQSFL